MDVKEIEKEIERILHNINTAQAEDMLCETILYATYNDLAKLYDKL